MTTSMLINAIGQALFESCGQALLIYIALQILFQLFPGISARYRYDINYLGLTIICCWFLANLVKIYLHNMALPHYNGLIYNGAITAGVAHVPTLLQRAEAFITTYAKYITGLYMIGLLLHAFRLIGGFVHVHHIRKQSNLTQDGLWQAKAMELCKKLNMVKKVQLYFSAHVQIPLTIGHLKPIIIFPIALISNLDNDQVEAILLHELAHIKRHDYLLNILQCVMETILCFNPFVWLISKAIRMEREYCCDDVVVDEDCNNFSYSKALFIIAQQTQQDYALAMASTGTKKYPLLNRIKRLNTMKTNDSLPKFHLLVILAVVAIAVVLAWGIPQYSVAKTRSHKKHISIVYPVDKFALSAPMSTAKQKAFAKTEPKKISLTPIADTVTNIHLSVDTSKDKRKFKIVISENGNTKEYTSLEAMPDSDRKEFLEANPSFREFDAFRFKFKDSMKFASMEKFRSSPEFKKELDEIRKNSAVMRKKFNSPEWKKQQEEFRKQAEKMRVQFDNPKFRKDMEDMQAKFRAQYDNPEFRKQMEDMQAKIRAQYDNPEYRKQVEDMQAKVRAEFNSPEWKKQMADIQKQSAEMQKKLNSAEWKEQVKRMKIEQEVMRKQMDSPEWKKEMEDMQKKIKDEVDEAMKKAEQDSVKVRN